VGETTLAILGLAGVIIAPAFRGQSRGKVLLAEAMNWAKMQSRKRPTKQGPWFAALFCRPHRRSLYESLGWQFLAQPIHFALQGQERKTDPLTLFAFLPLGTHQMWPDGEVHVGQGLW
jgi:GNAT superfamily N-acetyltransferase